MILKGTLISIGRHKQDGEEIHGVLIEAPKELLQQGGLLYREVVVTEAGQLEDERKAVESMVKAGDRLAVLLRCAAGTEDTEEWANSTRSQQQAMIAAAHREWRKRRSGS